MKNLELMGVQEMNVQEMKDENGGIAFWAAVAIGVLIGTAVGANVQIMSDWDNFKNGLLGLAEEK